MNSDRLIRIRLAGVVCRPEPGAQERKRDGEAGEARDHDEQTRARSTAPSADPTSWTMRPLAVPPACGTIPPRSSDLRRGGRRQRAKKRRAGERDAPHWMTIVSIIISLTLPVGAQRCRAR